MPTGDRPDIEDADRDPHLVLLIGGPPESSPIWAKVRPLLRSHGLTVLTGDRHCCRYADDHARAVVLIDPAAGSLAVTVTDRVLAAPIIGPVLSWVGFRTAGLALHIPALRTHVLTRRFGLTVTQAKGVVRLLTHGNTWRSFTTEQRRLVTDAQQLQKRLSKIRCPVVIVTAARERGLRPDHVAALAKQLPAATIVATDAEHVVPIDDPQTVVNAIVQAVTTVAIS